MKYRVIYYLPHPMELKSYQSQVIADLREYLEYIERFDDYSEAYSKYRKDKWFKVDNLDPKALPSYQNIIPKCPHICAKVPTAWGKTFIACNALRTIFDAYPALREQVVVWLVPSRTILDQTIKNLSNPDHPYRQKIETHFNGRVEVLSKDDLLQWRWFSSTSVKEQLTICVLSFDTFRSRRKEDRKIYQENGNLAWFTQARGKEVKVEGSDDTSLMHILHTLNPVVIVDESHNATTDLSIEMLQNLNPSFILDLTATPRKNSNIISYVSALELKKHNMVKLPVLVHNMQDKTDVIVNSINLQKSLEEQAIAWEKQWGKYIRPIVLFQAEPKSKKDNETFEKVKKKLIRAGIPEEQIAIKTANINEIKQRDLMSKDCPIRYIITVNALKEWRDCPFAYILASLANRSSSIDVTQILGRILRLPFVTKHKNEFLNVWYVFCASAKFHETLQNIVEWLNNAWFSKLTARADESAVEENDENLFVKVIDDWGSDLFWSEWEELDRSEWIDEEQLSSQLSTDWVQSPESATFIESLQEQVHLQWQKLDKHIQEAEQEWWLRDTDLASRIAKYPIRSDFETEIETLVLPQFHLEVEATWLFTDANSNRFPLEKENLNVGFNLDKADININFHDVSVDLYQVDVAEKNDEYVPEYTKSTSQVKSAFLSYIDQQPAQKHVQILTNLVFSEMKRLDDVEHKQLKSYIKRVLESLSTEKLQDVKQNPYLYAKRIKIKVKQLIDEHRKKQFDTRITQGKVSLQDSYTFPKHISPSETTLWVSKWLYTEEWSLNWFENEVIIEIANKENVVRWHKIIERKWFRINGWINHYPDFIVKTQKWNYLLVETKWDDRDNSDSKFKLDMWKKRANMAGTNFSYMMVFKENSINWSYTKGEFLDVLEEM